MSEWNPISLGDVLEMITKGTTPPKGKGFIEGKGINYIKSDAISYDGQIDTTKFVQIDEETHAKFQRSQIKKDDILFSMAGAFLGKNAVVPSKILPANTNQALAVIRVDQSKALPRFISYGLRNPTMISYVNSMIAQSAQPNINFKEISSLPFNLPPLPEQKAIAHILGKLDDKIELNRQMNQTLEEMAQVLFKSWFVDFDPVFDNALSAEQAGLAVGNEIPEDLKAKAERRTLVPDEEKLITKNPELTKLFPSTFTFNETLDKWIPEGWEVKKLGEAAIFGNGKTSPERNDEGRFPVFGSNGEIGKSNKFNREGTVIIGRVGSYCGSLFFVNEKCWITDNAMFAQMKETRDNLFLYEFLKLSNLNDRSTGSGQPLLNQGILKAIDIILPSERVLNLFSNQAIVFKSKTYSCQIQNETLTQLRDILLPQLISGKVRVPEGLVEEMANDEVV